MQNDLRDCVLCTECKGKDEMEHYLVCPNGFPAVCHKLRIQPKKISFVRRDLRLVGPKQLLFLLQLKLRIVVVLMVLLHRDPERRHLILTVLRTRGETLLTELDLRDLGLVPATPDAAVIGDAADRGVDDADGIVGGDRRRRCAARDGGFEYSRLGGADERLGQVEDQKTSCPMR